MDELLVLVDVRNQVFELPVIRSSWDVVLSRKIRLQANCERGCLWMCEQTLEELPLEFESASRPSSSFDSTGLPPPATRGSAMTPALYALINGDYAGAQSASGYLGASRNSKSKRSFSAEHSAAANGGIL